MSNIIRRTTAPKRRQGGVGLHHRRLVHDTGCRRHVPGTQFAGLDGVGCCRNGPQTPGELRARSGRLHEFADNTEVVTALNGLIEREADPLVVKLPRAPGRKDSEFMHLFSGPVDIEAHVAAAETSQPAAASNRGGITDLSERVDRLEAEMAELKEQLGVGSGD